MIVFLSIDFIWPVNKLITSSEEREREIYRKRESLGESVHEGVKTTRQREK